MNDRNRAIEVLKRARDLLAERLTERVLESRDDILADAMGLAYQSEIDAVYEQVGARLNHVSNMLGSLPAEPEPAEDTQTNTPAKTSDAVAEPPALPAPRPIAGYLATRERASFRTFALQVQAGDIGGVGTSLGVLFDLSPERGQQCADFFLARLRSDRTLMLKVRQLRGELASGNFHAVVTLLDECFGLQGVEAMAVIQALRTHLATALNNE